MKNRNLVVFQHPPEETMGYFETICWEWHLPFDYVRLFETNEVPDINATHVLIWGGPMSVNDTRTYPYLADEKIWIRSFVKSGIPVLGICLGAQLIANAFGGKVSSCEEEVGWREIRRIGTGIMKDVPSPFRHFRCIVRHLIFLLTGGSSLKVTLSGIRHLILVLQPDCSSILR